MRQWKDEEKSLDSSSTSKEFENFVDWRQCAAAMQREAVTVCQVVMVRLT
jgi:hypothetical protein